MSGDIEQALTSSRRDAEVREVAWRTALCVAAAVALVLTVGLLVLVTTAGDSSERDASSGSTSASMGEAASFVWCEGVDVSDAPMHLYLPCSSLDLIESAYKTDYIQGIRMSNLSPIAYAKYDLQDWTFLAIAAAVYRAVCDKDSDEACDDALAEFFAHEAESYQSYADAVVSRYSFIPDSEGSEIVDIAPATEGYNEYERITAAELDPKYSAVAMAPCLQLWSMLALRMLAEGPSQPGDAYFFWIEENAAYFPERLNAILDAEEFDKDLALSIYREGLRHEIAMFAWATEGNKNSSPRSMSNE